MTKAKIKKQIADGYCLVAQTRDIPGMVAVPLIIFWKKDRLDEFPLHARPHLLLSMDVWITLADATLEGRGDFKIEVSPPLAGQDVDLSFALSVVRDSRDLLRREWPHETEFVKGCFNGSLKEAEMAVYPYPLPGALNEIPMLFPSSAFGVMCRLPSPACFHHHPYPDQEEEDEQSA